MDNWRNNTIWFEQIPDNLQAYLNLKEDKFNEIQLENIEYLTLWHHKRNRLGNFVDIPENLLYLELNRSNIQNFLGIEKMNKFGTFFETGQLKLGYIDRDEKNDYIVLPLKETTVIAVNSKNPRDRIIQCLSSL